ncbi:hypothetical protein [Paenibacillus sp. MMS20-IR301]|uniref:hypothetical protein n=1 Tax=Paenibacillus sp. MMS20-IR301 TaxID=2895946 RepID=UPI0028E7F539|nr:hypothetical protein [Paenibacillus sp. MMS20-IR301]WNS43903.1 hypothetical protein LOS79_01160 [Paenibacillus sp. MMS20-IR301]
MIGLLEGIYLMRHGRKMRTYVIVYAVLCVSLVYNLMAIGLEQAINPNRLIQAVLRR